MFLNLSSIRGVEGYEQHWWMRVW